MNFDCVLIRYGELALKGKNQPLFIDCLVRNIKNKLAAYEGVTVVRQQGRLFIDLNGQDAESIICVLQNVFGIVGFSPALRVSNDLQSIERGLGQFVQDHNFRTFKIEARRANKSFEMTSQEMNHHFGERVLSTVKNVTVDVHNPELVVHIEVREKNSYIYGNVTKGRGGLPVGISGKVLLFLSGGIDSPVAGYLALKRGVELECMHFHSYPYTSKRAKKKVMDLAQSLVKYGGQVRMYMVPFTDVQLEIKKKCNEKYLITIMRRMMVRIAEEVTEGRIKGFVTGESLGQVASQTLESLSVIGSVTNKAVIRPLITMDKQEIISLAKEIGTFETSILPYEDCCTVFLPKSPKTKPNESKVQSEEEKLDIHGLIQSVVKNIEVISFDAETDHDDIFS